MSQITAKPAPVPTAPVRRDGWTVVVFGIAIVLAVAALTVSLVAI